MKEKTTYNFKNDVGDKRCDLKTILKLSHFFSRYNIKLSWPCRASTSRHHRDCKNKHHVYHKADIYEKFNRYSVNHGCHFNILKTIYIFYHINY